MLDVFAIVTRGGFVLWSRENHELKSASGAHATINAFISFLLEERGGSAGKRTFSSDRYAVKWTMANELGLIFIALYSNILQLMYVDELLDRVKEEFVHVYESELKSSCAKLASCSFEKFGKKFERIRESVEDQRHKSNPEDTGPRKPRTFAQVQADKTSKQSPVSTKRSSSSSDGTTSGGSSSDAKPIRKSEEEIDEDNSSSSTLTGKAKLQALLKTGKLGSRGKSSKKSEFEIVSESEKKPVKKMATSFKNEGRFTKEDLERVDQSEKLDDDALEEIEHQRVEELRERMLGPGRGLIPGLDIDESEEESDDEEEDQGSTRNTSSSSGGFFGFFKKMIGTKPLDEEDLRPALESVRETLLTKNVAQDIADRLCDSLRDSLIGKTPGTLKRVSTFVREAMEESLRRILTPKQSVDLLRNIQRVRENERRPFSIVFVGVNGVGKSTSLAKVTYWLLQQGLQCQLVACDTFRSGAIEQLRTHARALDVPLFAEAYGTDAAAVCQRGIEKARSSNIDVCLIDTAGRMQDNGPLMQALAKLIHVNRPDLILFVGEALVGNDAVDQLLKFNQALEDLSKDREARLIDGIVLTKFDTVDEKVGAAVSMVYTTGQPIMFVGVGQTYTDLRVLNVERIVRMLLR